MSKETEEKIRALALRLHTAPTTFIGGATTAEVVRKLHALANQTSAPKLCFASYVTCFYAKRKRGRLAYVIEDLAEFLIAKNRKYGDSALHPTRFFSTASPSEQILIRMDDKLSRLESAQSDDDEDALKDLVGYAWLLALTEVP